MRHLTHHINFVYLGIIKESEELVKNACSFSLFLFLFFALCFYFVYFILGTFFPDGDIWGARAFQRGEKKARNDNSLIILSSQSRIHPSLHDLTWNTTKSVRGLQEILNWRGSVWSWWRQSWTLNPSCSPKEHSYNTLCFHGGLWMMDRADLHARGGGCAHVNTLQALLPLFQQNVQ